MSELELLRDERLASTLGAWLRQSTPPLADQAGAEASLRRALAVRANAPARRGPIASWSLAALAVGALALALVFGVGTTRAPRPLEVEVVGAGTVSPNYVAAPDSAPATLRFSDGSRVLVEQGARLRVQQTTERGATLLLERGRAINEIVHRADDTRWAVLAGPFAIRVVGTRFAVDFDTQQERLVVELFDGAVEIDGPHFKEPAVVRRGQRFQASADSHAWSVVPLESVAALPAAESTASSAPEVEPTPVEPPAPARAMTGARAEKARLPEPASGSAEPTPASPSDWQKSVAQGDFARVVREAEAGGLIATLERSSAGQLRALADAARYTGRFDVAEAALRSLRSQHPAQATVAAYLLGTVAEARGRNDNARQWYDDYLAESPHGAFASEARAGRLRMVLATRGVVAARALAEQELRLSSKGVAAATARRILAGP